MKFVHVTLGAALVVLLAASVVAGVYVLRAEEGNGLAVVVSFDDPRGLEPDSNVLYGDRVVGRVELVSDGEVRVRIAAADANLVREHSRFWVQKNLGVSFLCFDSPPDSGRQAQPGSRFNGLAQQPAPAEAALPPPTPRRMDAKPAWLCDVQVVVTIREGHELTRDLRQRSAGVVAAVEGNTLIVLAPSWLFERDGEQLSLRARVELTGGENCTARLIETLGPLCALSVEGSTWRGPTARLWPDALPDDQGLLLADFEGTAWSVKHRANALEFRGTLEGGNVALIEGVNVAGFALPAVGERFGARWLPLNGASALIEKARAKLK